MQPFNPIKVFWNSIKSIPERISRLIALTAADGAIFLDVDGNYRIVPFGNSADTIAEGNHTHSLYQALSEKNQPGGYVGLSSTKEIIDISRIVGGYGNAQDNFHLDSYFSGNTARSNAMYLNWFSGDGGVYIGNGNGGYGSLFAGSASIFGTAYCQMLTARRHPHAPMEGGQIELEPGTASNLDYFYIDIFHDSLRFITKVGGNQKIAIINFSSLPAGTTSLV
ncbi:MAG: hypothetical protein AAGJ08_01820 [Cyanobacteria bacterium P01_H01_bin.35]